MKIDLSNLQYKQMHPDYRFEIEDLKISYDIEVNDLRPLGQL